MLFLEARATSIRSACVHKQVHTAIPARPQSRRRKYARGDHNNLILCAWAMCVWAELYIWAIQSEVLAYISCTSHHKERRQLHKLPPDKSNLPLPTKKRDAAHTHQHPHAPHTYLTPILTHRLQQASASLAGPFIQRTCYKSLSVWRPVVYGV